jgi:membrane-associated phospholipid phosphatase
MIRMTERQERALIFIGVWIFWMTAYFGIGNVNVARHAWTLGWDPVARIPLVSWFVIPYLSLYVMPLAPFFALRDKETTRKFALVTVAAIAFCAAVFLLLPLTIVRPEIVGTSPFDWLLARLYATDRPINMLPSMHVALAYLFAFIVAKEYPRSRFAMLAWATLIAISTLFTHQHYAVDAIGGLAVAWAAWRIFYGHKPDWHNP